MCAKNKSRSQRVSKLDTSCLKTFSPFHIHQLSLSSKLLIILNLRKITYQHDNHTDHPHYHGWLPLKSITVVAAIWFLYHAPLLTFAKLT